MAYEVIEPTLIPNTTMKKYINDSSGRWLTYNITPNEGYCLHDTQYDEPVFDEETMEETGEIKLGYCLTTCTCGYNYDFTTTIVDGYTAYGDRQFFARPISEVPTD